MDSLLHVSVFFNPIRTYSESLLYVEQEIFCISK